MPSFFDGKNFLNITYAIDIGIINHYAALLFENDVTRIIYSSNAYAFRKRSKENSGNLTLPFINFKLIKYEPARKIQWHARARTTGEYISDVSQYISYIPVRLEYEATFWCNRDDELRYAYNKFLFESDIKTEIEDISVEVKDEESEENVEIALFARLSFTNLSFEPTYTEKDWLDRNKIHSCSFSFALDTFNLNTNSNICIPTQAILEFAIDNGHDDYSYEESLEFTINHLTEEVEESES